MESIMTYLRRRLREVDPAAREAIAKECDRSPHLLRKIACGDRVNPGIANIQPVLDYLQAIDRGEKSLPVIDKAA